MLRPSATSFLAPLLIPCGHRGLVSRISIAFLLIATGCTSPEKIQESETTVVFRHGLLPTVVDSGDVTLEPGDSAVVEVWARLPTNNTRIVVAPGMRFQFLVPAGQTWTDWFIQTKACGYPHGPLPFIQEIFASTKPLPGENWFALTGAVGSPDQSPFLIGGKPVVVPMTASGELVLFANDARSFYWNNFGRIQVVVSRVE